MTKEEKQLLIKEICSRLTYGVKITCFKNSVLTPYLIDFRDNTIHAISDFNGTYIKVQLEDCKIYLRPMSSMTEEERNNLQSLHDIISNENYGDGYSSAAWEAISEWEDYCNSRHLDYRGLISMGLALEAPEDMYEI